MEGRAKGDKDGERDGEVGRKGKSMRHGEEGDIELTVIKICYTGPGIIRKNIITDTVVMTCAL